MLPMISFKKFHKVFHVYQCFCVKFFIILTHRQKKNTCTIFFFLLSFFFFLLVLFSKICTF